MSVAIDKNIVDKTGNVKLVAQNLCGYCIHLYPNDAPSHACKAYPDGIPQVFWSGKSDHTAPYKGDSGITFTPK